MSSETGVHEPIFKGARWLLLKRPANQTRKQAAKLDEILQYNLKSVRGHLMKEYFQQFWEYGSPVWAGKFLDQWCTRAMRSRSLALYYRLYYRVFCVYT